MVISVVGIGLIGGSFALALKSLGHEVIGIDANPAHLAQAAQLELVDRTAGFDDGLHDANLIILATPVDVNEQLLPVILDTIQSHQVVMDVGSTKFEICQMVQQHPNRGRFVAAHPLAGTEFSGPTAALQSLFDGNKNIICESEKSDMDALDMVIRLLSEIGMDSYFLSPDVHDKHLAYVSHLSHVSSFLLGQTVLDIEKDEQQILNLASTGFASTVRLAKSSPTTWASIFSKNKQHLGVALDEYIAHLQQFRNLLEIDDVEAMKAIMVSANAIKRVLKQ